MLVLSVPVSAAELERISPTILTEATHPATEPKSSVVIGRAVKADDSTESIARSTKKEIKIYGTNPFYGISGSNGGIQTAQFTSTTYNNIQVNSWAEATNYTSGDYNIELLRKPNWFTSAVSYGSMDYPFGLGVGTYVGTWYSVGPIDKLFCIISHSAGSTLKIDGEITVYETNQ